jgi:hypothetical protein
MVKNYKRTAPGLFLLIFLTILPSVIFSENLVINPAFNGMTGWSPSNPVSVTVSGGCLLLNNGSTPAYCDAVQDIKLTGLNAPCLTVKADIKISGVVKGSQEWEMARVMVLFFDASGAQVGGWPELGRWKGTFDWAQKISVISVPAGAASLKVQVQLCNCTGEMEAKNISIEPGDSMVIPRDADDFLMNGSFEYGSTLPLYWGGWVSGDSSFDYPGYKSASCFKITNTSPGYSMITQKAAVTPGMSSIEISGYVKTSGVAQGANTWEKARISVEFRDADGNLKGGWPPVVGEAAYDISDWTQWDRTYNIPAGTSVIIVGAGLLNCTGTMWFDDIKLKAFDKSGRALKSVSAEGQDRKGWFAFDAPADDYRPGAVIDFTSSLDAPAGKHGPVTITASGSLAFADSTPARFWGTNIVGSDLYRGHKEADLLVKRLAKLGANIVRLHHMDAYWADPNIFSTDRTKGLLSPDSLDKLDYLVYRLKQAGIYMFMDILVHRKAVEADGIKDFSDIPAGFKEVIFFDPALQSLTKDYIKALLTHVNPYTGTAYKDENAVVLMEIVNESSLFSIDRDSAVPARFRDELDRLFNGYLKSKYSTMDSLKSAWPDLAAGEDFNSSSVKRASFDYDYDSWQKTGSGSSGARAADTKEFYYGLEKSFFRDFYSYIKSIGTKALIAGSNHWEKWDADLMANASMDFIDRHTYWDHPSGGWTMQDNLTFTDLPMIKSARNCVVELGQQRVAGMPFTCSEFNSPLPNEFRAGYPVIMASYAALNGWDAMLQFSFSNYAWQDSLGHFTDISAWPDMLAFWYPAIKIFRDGYAAQGTQKMAAYIPPKDALSGSSPACTMINNDINAPLLGNSAKTFDADKARHDISPALKKDSALSSTGELYWNFKKGVFEIAAEKIQGAAGFLSADKSFSFSSLKIKCSNKYAAIFLTSLDGKPLLKSSRMLLTTAARIDNTGVRYDSTHTSLIYGGTSPILLEPVYSQCTITTSRFKKSRAYKLDANNYITGEYKNFSRSGGNSITIKTDENSKVLSYYIEFER